MRALEEVDWSLTDAPSPHAVHQLHPYPAKFVPALPREVIRLLTSPGDLVVDPFCGCGTALVEALLLGRRAAGSDINPVAITAARAKTTKLRADQVLRLKTLAADVPRAAAAALALGQLELPEAWDPLPGKRFRGLSFWFDHDIALDLAALRSVLVEEADEDVRNVAMMCFSAIIVAVSYQDSDTRYVRREKALVAGDAIKLFCRRLGATIDALAALSTATESSADIRPCDAREVDYLEPNSVRLVVTSPPYPNAWSYHLYHQNRILWLDADPWEFKAAEIGHHRAYSAKNGSGAEDFQEDMRRVFASVAPSLRADGHVVVVVGDSIVRGEVVRNDTTVTAAASDAGFTLTTALNRVIDPRRKAFNPAIGKIRTEHILVFNAA